MTTIKNKKARDAIIPAVLREVSVGAWLANRINRVDRAAKAGNFDEQEMNLFAIRGYLAALVNTEYFNSRQEDAILELVDLAKKPNIACGLEYWQRQVGHAIERWREEEEETKENEE